MLADMATTTTTTTEEEDVPFPRDLFPLLHSFADGMTQRKLEVALDWPIAGVRRLPPPPFDLFFHQLQFVEVTREFTLVILPINDHIRYVYEVSGSGWEEPILEWEPDLPEDVTLWNIPQDLPWKCTGVCNTADVHVVDVWKREQRESTSTTTTEAPWRYANTLFQYVISFPRRNPGRFTEAYYGSTSGDNLLFPSFKFTGNAKQYQHGERRPRRRQNDEEEQPFFIADGSSLVHS